MALIVSLLGRPQVRRPGGSVYAFRSRKSWALLAYLLLGPQPPSRQQLASLLFPEADDPLRALRWNLAEVRRCLGADGSVDGDPVVLRRQDVLVDVDVVTRGTWAEAVALPGLGSGLLEGAAIRGAAAFDSWMLSEQRRVSAASETILHEAALGCASRGSLEQAREYAVRASAMSPLDENHQALIIRLYRLAGDDDGAQRQFAAFSRLLAHELGVSPGAAVLSALRQTPQLVDQDGVSIDAVMEGGCAAVSAGASEAGVHSLRAAVRLADRTGDSSLRVRARLVLAEALVHSLGGLDEEGMAELHQADAIARTDGDQDGAARARAELGYVDFLRGRYDRAEVWLVDARTRAAGSPAVVAKAVTYLGAVASDRAQYVKAESRLREAIALTGAIDDPRRESFARSMLGRVHLLRGDLDAADQQLQTALRRAEGDHWLAFLPWPAALLGHVHLARGDVGEALRTLEQAFARACLLGDPCWEGMAARGLALVAEATGAPERAFELLQDGRRRCNRLEDPYVWLDVHLLDALCHLGRRHGHPNTAAWVEQMRAAASRTGMSEMTVRALLHGAALGQPGDAAAAALIATSVDSPLLQTLVVEEAAGQPSALCS